MSADGDTAQEALVRRLTQIVREIDPEFEKEGGSTRHWVRDFFLPAIDAEELAVVEVAALARLEAAEAQLAEAERTWKNQQAITRDEMKRADEYQSAYQAAEGDRQARKQAEAQRDTLAEALRDLVAWADDQEAMTGVEAIASLLLRFDRARAALVEAGLAAEEA